MGIHLAFAQADITSEISHCAAMHRFRDVVHQMNLMSCTIRVLWSDGHCWKTALASQTYLQVESCVLEQEAPPDRSRASQPPKVQQQSTRPRPPHGSTNTGNRRPADNGKGGERSRQPLRPSNAHALARPASVNSSASAGSAGKRPQKNTASEHRRLQEEEKTRLMILEASKHDKETGFQTVVKRKHKKLTDPNRWLEA